MHVPCLYNGQCLYDSGFIDKGLSVVDWGPGWRESSGLPVCLAGADWLILKGYQAFSWGDRDGSIAAISVLPKHRLDQQLSDYISSKTAVSS